MLRFCQAVKPIEWGTLNFLWSRGGGAQERSLVCSSWEAGRGAVDSGTASWDGARGSLLVTCSIFAFPLSIEIWVFPTSAQFSSVFLQIFPAVGTSLISTNTRNPKLLQRIEPPTSSHEAIPLFTAPDLLHRRAYKWTLLSDSAATPQQMLGPPLDWFNDLAETKHTFILFERWRFLTSADIRFRPFPC